MTQFFQIHPDNPQARLIKQAAQILRSGGVVALPTDSAYALVCQLDDKNAVEKLRRVRGIDATNATITAEAGCVLQTLQKAAADAGFLFPLSLAAEGSCTLGGNLATNAGGTQVLRFGNARDLCLGIEAVGARGGQRQGCRGAGRSGFRSRADAVRHAFPPRRRSPPPLFLILHRYWRSCKRPRY